MSGPRDLVRGAQASLIRERAGLPTARGTAADVAAMRRPTPPNAVQAPVIDSAVSSGDALTDLLASLDSQGIVSDQSRAGSDLAADPRDDASAPGTDVNSLSDGMAQVWSDAANAWLPGGPFDVIVAEPLYQDNSDTPSTTATVTYQDACTMNLFLPPGVWTVTANGMLRAIRSSSGNVNCRVNIDGVDGPGRTIGVTTAIYTVIYAGQKLTGVSGGRTIQIKFRFKSGTAATTTVNSPALSSVIAQRQS